MNEIAVHLPDTGATRAFGEALAALLRAGDLVVLSGDLGAGKTTLTQGIGAGLGIRGKVASPTFIIARVHPSVTGGPALVHVDAYRLGSLDELEALDLDASLDESVTVAGIFQSEPEKEYIEFLIGKIAAGVETAWKQREPAKVGWGAGSDPSQVFNRRWHTAEGVVNTDPFGDGWMLKVKPSNPAELDALLAADDYAKSSGH